MSKKTRSVYKVVKMIHKILNSQVAIPSSQLDCTLLLIVKNRMSERKVRKCYSCMRGRSSLCLFGDNLPAMYLAERNLFENGDSILFLCLCVRFGGDVVGARFFSSCVTLCFSCGEKA